MFSTANCQKRPEQSVLFRTKSKAGNELGALVDNSEIYLEASTSQVSRSMKKITECAKTNIRPDITCIPWRESVSQSNCCRSLFSFLNVSTSSRAYCRSLSSFGTSRTASRSRFISWSVSSPLWSGSSFCRSAPYIRSSFSRAASALRCLSDRLPSCLSRRIY